MTIKSIFCVITFAIIDIVTEDLIWSSIGILVTDVIIFILYDLAIIKGYSITIHILTKENFKKLLVGGLSVFIYTFIIQYILNLQKYIIDFTLDNEAQTYFGILIMPATIMTICSQFITNPMIYDINKSVQRKNFSNFIKITGLLFLIILGIGIIIIPLAYFWGLDIIELIFSFNMDQYFYPLMILISCSILFALVSVMQNIYIALRKNKIQVIIYSISALISTIISIELIKLYAVNGACISFSLTIIIIFIMYAVFFLIEIYRLKNRWRNNE